MFFNETRLKAMMRQAYKGDGLILFRLDENTLYMAGGYWKIECKMDFIPKKIIACMYELAGEIPEAGGFSATKDGNQELLDLAVHNGINTNGFGGELKVSRTLQIGAGGALLRLLQDTDTGDVFAVKNQHLDAVDPSMVMKEKGESNLNGPLFNKHAGILFWNNVCKYMTYFRSEKETDVIMNAVKGSWIVEDLKSEE